MRPSIRARLELDLSALSRLLSLEVLRREFAPRLRVLEEGVVEEIYAIAQVSAGADGLRLHEPVAEKGKRNCDALILRLDSPIACEVKHRKDDFPFNSRAQVSEDGLEFFEATRPGVDHRFLDLPNPDTSQPLPGSNIWREAVLGALPQLPVGVAGVVALSVDAFGEFEDDIFAALHGDEVMVATPAPDGVGSIHSRVREGNGAFQQPTCRSLAGVWAFRLRPDEADTILLADWSRWFANPAFEGVLPDWATKWTAGLADG